MYHLFLFGHHSLPECLAGALVARMKIIELLDENQSEKTKESINKPVGACCLSKKVCGCNKTQFAAADSLYVWKALSLRLALVLSAIGMAAVQHTMSYRHLHHNMHHIFSWCWLTAHHMHIYILQSTLLIFHLKKIVNAVPS